MRRLRDEHKAQTDQLQVLSPLVALMIHDVYLATVRAHGHVLRVDGNTADGILGNDVEDFILDPIIHQLWLRLLSQVHTRHEQENERSK